MIEERKGFTLIELAIVIVIIGLIISGVLGAQSLIQSSKRNSVIREVTEIRTAIEAFRLEYDSLPGDFDEAMDYWPSCPNPGHIRCNGNGDGVIYSLGGSVEGGFERNRAWAHMAYARIYNKVSEDSNSVFAVIGENVPQSDYEANTGYVFSSRFDLNRRYVTLNFGSTSSNSSELLQASVSPNAAYWIDKKMDDGEPNLCSSCKFGYVSGRHPWGGAERVPREIGVNTLREAMNLHA